MTVVHKQYDFRIHEWVLNSIENVLKISFVPNSEGETEAVMAIADGSIAYLYSRFIVEVK